MWVSSPGDKLTGDFGNEPDATSISDRGLFQLAGGKFVARHFLRHNLQTFSDIPANTLYRPRSAPHRSGPFETFRAIQNIATIQFSSGFIWGIPAINN